MHLPGPQDSQGESYAAIGSIQSNLLSVIVLITLGVAIGGCTCCSCRKKLKRTGEPPYGKGLGSKRKKKGMKHVAIDIPQSPECANNGNGQSSNIVIASLSPEHLDKSSKGSHLAHGSGSVGSLSSNDPSYPYAQMRTPPNNVAGASVLVDATAPHSGINASSSRALPDIPDRNSMPPRPVLPVMSSSTEDNPIPVSKSVDALTTSGGPLYGIPPPPPHVPRQHSTNGTAATSVTHIQVTTQYNLIDDLNINLTRDSSTSDLYATVDKPGVPPPSRVTPGAGAGTPPDPMPTVHRPQLPSPLKPAILNHSGRNIVGLPSGIDSDLNTFRSTSISSDDTLTKIGRPPLPPPAIPPSEVYIRSDRSDDSEGGLYSRVSDKKAAPAGLYQGTPYGNGQYDNVTPRSGSDESDVDPLYSSVGGLAGVKNGLNFSKPVGLSGDYRKDGTSPTVPKIGPPPVVPDTPHGFSSSGRSGLYSRVGSAVDESYYSRIDNDRKASNRNNDGRRAEPPYSRITENRTDDGGGESGSASSSFCDPLYARVHEPLYSRIRERPYSVIIDERLASTSRTTPMPSGGSLERDRTSARVASPSSPIPDAPRLSPASVLTSMKRTSSDSMALDLYARIQKDDASAYIDQRKSNKAQMGGQSSDFSSSSTYSAWRNTQRGPSTFSGRLAHLQGYTSGGRGGPYEEISEDGPSPSTVSGSGVTQGSGGSVLIPIGGSSDGSTDGVTTRSCIDTGSDGRRMMDPANDRSKSEPSYRYITVREPLEVLRERMQVRAHGAAGAASSTSITSTNLSQHSRIGGCSESAELSADGTNETDSQGGQQSSLPDPCTGHYYATISEHSYEVVAEARGQNAGSAGGGTISSTDNGRDSGAVGSALYEEVSEVQQRFYDDLNENDDVEQSPPSPATLQDLIRVPPCH